MIGKHVVIDTLDNFKAKLDLIPSSAIVLIKDVGQIYAHGTYFGAQKTYSLLTKTADGLAPKGGTSASSLISDVNTEWVLTVTNGENPTWRKLPANAFSSSSYTLSSATTSDLGGIKVGQVYTATFNDLVGLYYKINIDKNGLAYVHVPWINNPYTASGSGITLQDNVFSLSLNSVTKLDSAIGSKIYAVSLDKNGKLCVSVPWTDTNNIFVGATETKNGSSGMVPAPIANQHNYFLRGDGTWVKPNLSDLNDDVVNGKYLPLTGGTLTDVLKIKTNRDVHLVLNSGDEQYNRITFQYNGTEYASLNFGEEVTQIKGLGTLYYNSNQIYHSGNFNPSDYLPLTGGTLTGSTATILTINRTSGNPIIRFLYNGTLSGYIGVQRDTNIPIWVDASANTHEIIHAGNIGSQSVGNASTADKLQNTVKLWGLDFDGTGDVNGSLYINNNNYVYTKDTGGTGRALLGLDSNNNFLIGLGSATVGYDTRIYGNNTYLLYGTSRAYGLMLNSSGNVGIGTTAPDYKLDVNGYVYASTTANDAIKIGAKNDVANLSLYAAKSGNHGVWSDTKGSWLIYTNGTNTILSIGYVGIGKTPSYTLDVNGHINSTASGYFTNYVFSNANAEGLYIGNSIFWHDASNKYASTLITFSKNSIALKQSTTIDSTLLVTGATTLGSSLSATSGTFSSTLNVGSATISTNLVRIYNSNKTYRAMFNYNDADANTLRIYSIYDDGSTFGAIKIGNTDGTQLYLKGNGYVGIGTKSPAYKLDVTGTFNASSNATIGGTLSVTGTSTLKSVVATNVQINNSQAYNIKTSDGGNIRALYLDTGTLHLGTTDAVGVDTYVTGNNVHLRYGPSASMGFTLSDKGYVGIGTTKPAYRLEVNGNISASRGIFGRVLVNKGYGNHTGDQTIETSSEGLMLYLQYYHNGGINLCQGGGNVGIGTTSPASKLHVEGTTKTKRVNIYGGEVTDHTKGLYFLASDNSSRARLYYNGNTDTGLLGLESYYSNIAIILPSAKNVGIGTTDPKYKLDVSGVIRANGNILLEAANNTTGGGIAFWNGSGYVNGTINASKLILNYAGGNVGIGTLSPAYKLEVNGSLNATTIYQNGTTLSNTYLSLTGGTITSASWLPLNINSTDSGGGVAIKLSTNGVKRGGLTYNTKGLQLYNENSQKFISVTDDGIPMFSDNTLIHSGNISSQSVNYATSAGNSDTVDNLHATDFVKFYLSPLETNAPAASAKTWFTNTMPAKSGAIVYNVPGSEKTIIVGKSSGAYGHMLQLNYDDTYLRILRYAGGSWKSTDWEKISAGYADSAGYAAKSNVIALTTAAENDCVPSSFDTMQHYKVSSSTTGGADGYMQAYVWNSGQYVTQIYYDVDSTNIMALRHRTSGGDWTSWMQICKSSTIRTLTVTSSPGTDTNTIYFVT